MGLAGKFSDIGVAAIATLMSRVCCNAINVKGGDMHSEFKG